MANVYEKPRNASMEKVTLKLRIEVENGHLIVNGMRLDPESSMAKHYRAVLHFAIGEIEQEADAHAWRAERTKRRAERLKDLITSATP